MADAGRQKLYAGPLCLGEIKPDFVPRDVSFISDVFASLFVHKLLP